MAEDSQCKAGNKSCDPCTHPKQRFAEKCMPVSPVHGSAMARELTTSFHHIERCGRVTAFIRTGTALSLDLTLLNYHVKIPSLGTCITILNVRRIFCSY